MNDQLESFFNLNSAGAIAAPATVFIYGLNDPTTGKCRYVGKAVNPHKRFGNHLLGAKEGRFHKDRWIRGLAERGLEPVLEVLDEVPASEWKFWEREYIRVFRMIGFNLTNISVGGGGSVMTEEIRAKISASNSGKKRSLEARAKMRAAHIGKPLSEQHLRSIALAKSLRIPGSPHANRGKKHSEEHKEKNRLAHLGHVPWNKGKPGWGLGRRLSDESKRKMSAAHRGKTISEETRAKISASSKGKIRSPEHCAKISASKIGKNLGRKPSEETLLKRSEALKAAWKRRKLSKEYGA